MGRLGTNEFREADRLYRAGRYEDSLAILRRLDRAYPNDRHLLFPIARCCFKLGYDQEAMRICHDLLARFDYRRAEELLEKLQSTPPPRWTPMIQHSNAQQPQPAPPRRSLREWASALLQARRNTPSEPHMAAAEGRWDSVM